MYWLIPLAIMLVTFGYSAYRSATQYGEIIPSGYDLIFAVWWYGGSAVISLVAWLIWALATRTG